jgi:GxxExxY protein
LQDETRLIIGLAYDIHKHLGRGFLEIVYKDAMEYELNTRDVLYEREKEYRIAYKKIILPHKFYADFVVFNELIVEIKAKEEIGGEYIAQTLNYLKVSGCKVGLILNFGETSLKIKRVVL